MAVLGWAATWAAGWSAEARPRDEQASAAGQQAETKGGRGSSPFILFIFLKPFSKTIFNTILNLV